MGRPLPPSRLRGRLSFTLGGMQLVVISTRVALLNRLLVSSRFTVTARSGRPSNGGRRATAASRRCPVAGVTPAPAGAVPRAGLSVQASLLSMGAGRPSVGGRRAGCGGRAGHRRAGLVISSDDARHRRATKPGVSRQVSSLGSQPAASGLPNSTLQRTANGVAVGCPLNF